MTYFPRYCDSLSSLNSPATTAWSVFLEWLAEWLADREGRHLGEVHVLRLSILISGDLGLKMKTEAGELKRGGRGGREEGGTPSLLDS
eukprot:285290-Chlamydomonas_euryale.AAC.1